MPAVPTPVPPGARVPQRRARGAPTNALSFSVLHHRFGNRRHSLMVMPASLMTGPHLSISVFRNAASSAELEPATTTPICSSFAFVAGSVTAANVSACTLRTISGGGFAGANRAYHDDT